MNGNFRSACHNAKAQPERVDLVMLELLKTTSSLEPMLTYMRGVLGDTRGPDGYVTLVEMVEWGLMAKGHIHDQVSCGLLWSVVRCPTCPPLGGIRLKAVGFTSWDKSDSVRHSGNRWVPLGVWQVTRTKTSGELELAPIDRHRGRVKTGHVWMGPGESFDTN